MVAFRRDDAGRRRRDRARVSTRSVESRVAGGTDGWRRRNGQIGWDGRRSVTNGMRFFFFISMDLIVEYS